MGGAWSMRMVGVYRVAGSSLSNRPQFGTIFREVQSCYAHFVSDQYPIVSSAICDLKSHRIFNTKC